MLIVGLGNPGEKYEGTYHNLGFAALDAVADAIGVKTDRKGDGALYCKTYVNGRKVVLAKPQTFMNLSGESVRMLLGSNGFSPEECVILYDDVEIPVGTLRARASGSAGTHNGMRSVIAETGSTAFKRVRIGAGFDRGRAQLRDIVLSKIRGENKELADGAISEAAAAIVRWLEDGDFDALMRRCNTYGKEKR